MWWQVAFYIFMAVLSYYMRPKPPSPDDALPAGLSGIDFPTAEAGREIPVVFGSRWVKGPNVVWYGDLRTTPIKEG